MEIEFKEKTFEKYFGQELARLTNVSFSPDQVDEGMLGFDDAFLLPIPLLVSYIPFVRRARMARMSGIFIQELATLISHVSRRMPPFRFNLFLQYKRPEYMISYSATEWPYWRDAYYRYKITPHQHALLEGLETAAKGRASTLYASPAFCKSQDLFAHAQNEAIIENSNIAGVFRLRGHHRYTYVNAGFQGKAHSDTSHVSSSPLQEIIDNGRRTGAPLSLSQHLKDAAELISAVVTASGEATTALYSLARAARGFPGGTGDTLIDAILTIAAFSEAFSVSLYPVSEA